MQIFFLLLTVAVLTMPAFAADPSKMSEGTGFTPGLVWLDDAGASINCHGGGFIFRDGVYYWFGEHKIRQRDGGHIGVACYSSTDLYHWKNRGVVLSAGAESGDLVDGCVIERPKVLFNSRTKKFVMWFHLELKGQGYKAARAAVAVSDSATGPFKYLNSFRPNAGVWPMNFPERLRRPLSPGETVGDDPDQFVRRDFAGGQMSRDMTLFQDDDGTAYQIYASEENQTTQISKLSDDYLKPAGEYVRILIGEYNEAASIFKRKGRYNLITSGTSGWRPNDARLAAADQIFGRWKSLGNPCVGSKEQISITFGSQAAFVLPVAGKSDAFIYVGDRWRSRNLPASLYVWLPMMFDGDRPQLAWRDRWDLTVFDSANK